MVRKRRVGIRNAAERVLLSEVLPYEVPITFSNAGFYAFLIRSKARFVNDGLVLQSKDQSTHTIIRMIFGASHDYSEKLVDGTYSYRIGRSLLMAPTVPFTFQIRHKSSQSRQLSIAHPGSQIAIAAFYEKYKSLMLLHTANSPYSVRYPARNSRYTVIKDSVFAELHDHEHKGVESASAEYDRIRSFFVYQRYDNIHKFYESMEYRESEKQFGHLLRLDVQKCFDSIYTHSIEWAVYGKQTVKTAREEHATAFAASFDELMRNMNDGETHGILIGPEVSRIFAETILQSIDRQVEADLLNEGLIHQQDYEVLRYVDDYFIFMRDPGMRDQIVAAFERALLALPI